MSTHLLLQTETGALRNFFTSVSAKTDAPDASLPRSIHKATIMCPIHSRRVPSLEQFQHSGSGSGTYIHREHILADPLEVGDMKTVNVVFTLTFGWVNRALGPTVKIQKSARQWYPFYYVTTTFLPPNSCHTFSDYAVNDVQRPTYAIVYVCPQNIGRKWVS